MECGCFIDACPDPDGSWQMLEVDKDAISLGDVKCDECNRTIWAGERFERMEGVWEGEACTNNRCQDCLTVLDVLVCSSCYGGLYEGIQSELEYNGLEGFPVALLAKLTPRGRDFICSIVEDIWRDEEDEEAFAAEMEA